MSVKFFKENSHWVYQKDSDDVEYVVPSGKYELKYYNTQVTIHGINTPTNTLFKNVEVTEIVRDRLDNTYASVADFITICEEFFITTVADGGGSGAVDSVNGQTGVVLLDLDDIPDGTTNVKIPATTKADYDALLIPTAGHVVVAKTGGDFTSVKDACDWVRLQPPSPTNPYTIEVYGSYTEDPFELPAYCKLHIRTGEIIASTDTAPLITMLNGSEIVGGKLTGGANNDVVSIQGLLGTLTQVSIYPQNGCGVSVFDSPRMLLRNVTVVGGTHGICCHESVLILTTSSSTNATVAALEVESISSAIVDSFVAINCALDLSVLDADSVVRMNASQINIDKVSAVSYENLFLSFNSPKEDDEALVNAQEVHVGVPEKGREFCSGEGDSYTRGMMVWTESDLGVFTDVSTAAASPSASPFSFPNAEANSAIYLSTDLKDDLGNYLKFYGGKTSVSTPANWGSGSIVLEYYNDVNGWIQGDIMETQAGGRYYQYADQIFKHTGSFHIRANIFLSVLTDAANRWDLSDPISSGQSRYWIRFRIVDGVTIAPVFEQFKLHTNRTEINADGWGEYFGSARPEGLLPLTIGSGRELAGNIGNTNIWYGNNTGVGLVNNGINSTNHYFGWAQPVPDDLDTSSFLVLKFAGRSDSDQIVQFRVIYSWVTQGDTIYTANPTAGSNPTETVTLTETRNCLTGQQEFFTAVLDLSGARARKDPADGNIEPDILSITINPVAIPGEIALNFAEAKYYKWCEGGHI